MPVFKTLPLSLLTRSDNRIVEVVYNLGRGQQEKEGEDQRKLFHRNNHVYSVELILKPDGNSQML